MPSDSRVLPEDLRAAFDCFPFPSAEGLHTPELGQLEKEYLTECIDSGYVSSSGAFVERFESELARFSGAKYAVATSSGTTALHLALLAVGVKPGDIVLLPALTFVATANAVAHCGAIPIALDVEKGSMGLDHECLAEFLESQTKPGRQRGRLHRDSGASIKAVIAVHVLGHPCDIVRIREVCEKYGLSLVEDSAESIGSYVSGIHTGLFGSVGVFSFNGNKTITTGGGGCVVTHDKEIADRVRHIGTTARIPDPIEFDHDVVGYNYRMPNLNAALGCAQLERLPDILKGQRKLHDVYKQHFTEVNSASLLDEPKGCKSNFWLHALKLHRAELVTRDIVLDYGLAQGIPLRPLWKPIPIVQAHRHGMHGEIPVASTLYESVICLPSSPSLVNRSSTHLGEVSESG